MDVYLNAGQTWSPARYAGFVQFGLWLLTPRAVREFRGSTVPRAEFAVEFESLVAAVDRVWTDPVLQQFWRQSELVPNRARRHPYQTDIPERWRNADRWFVLATNLDPPAPWSLATQLPVFALARVRGSGDARQWLLYAHSPVQARDAVTIELPDFGPVKVRITPGGDFYLIQATDRSVVPVRQDR